MVMLSKARRPLFRNSEEFMKTTRLLCLVAVPMLSPGCKTSPQIATGALHCDEKEIVARIPDLTLKIITVLRAGGTGWQSILLALVSAAGGACAWDVVYAQVKSDLRVNSLGESSITLSAHSRTTISDAARLRADEFQSILKARADSAKAAR